jgi:hypothetical protein
MQTPSAPVTHAPRSLWEAARALIVTIFNLFGAPEAIAAQHTLQRKERSLILDWLRAGEAMVRHLLLIEASHYPRIAPRTRPRAKRTRARKLMSFEADQPETWRVTFRCFPSKDRRLPAGTASKPARKVQDETSCRLEAGGPRLYAAWPLAERAEAMLRAFNDPAPYAKRLARRLSAAPRRAALLTRHPPNLPQIVDDFPLLTAEAEASRRRFESG